MSEMTEVNHGLPSLNGLNHLATTSEGIENGASAPLKTNIPLQEVSAVREEPISAPAAAQYLPSDDRNFAAATISSATAGGSSDMDSMPGAEHDSTPLNTHIPMQEVSAVREEPIPAAAAAAQYLPSEEKSSAAEATSSATAGHSSDMDSMPGTMPEEVQEPVPVKADVLDSETVKVMDAAIPEAPIPEIPAVQEEPAPAAVHYLPSDDRSTAAAASAATDGDQLVTESMPVVEHEPVSLKVDTPMEELPEVKEDSIPAAPQTLPSDDKSTPVALANPVAVSQEPFVTQPMPSAEHESSSLEEDTPMQEAPAVRETSIPAIAPIDLPTENTSTSTVAAASHTPAEDKSVVDAVPKQEPQSIPLSNSTTFEAKPSLAGPESTTMTPAQIKFCQNAVKALKGRPEAGPFLAPVDYMALNIPHYPDRIKEPMDLGTIDIRLALTAAAAKGSSKPTEKTKQASKWNLDPVRDVFPSVEAFERDVRLVFNNCVTFNGPDHILSQNAKTLEGVFEKQLKTLPSAGPVTPAALTESETPILDTPITPNQNGGAMRRASDVASRPKRDIHPPAPKDLPWTDRPHGAPGTGKKKKAKRPLTAREEAYYEKITKDQFKFFAKFIDDLHKAPLDSFAWVFFAKPTMDLEFAASYYAIIKKPISLKEIKEKLVKGDYDSIDEAKDDLDLMLNNCFTFNTSDSDVHGMGMEVKKAWETRLAKMPQPMAMEEEEEEEEGEEEDDGVAEAQAQMIRDQIANLQAQLDGLQGGNKAAGAKLLASAKANLASIPGKKSTKKRRPSEISGSAKKPSSVKKAKVPPTAGPSSVTTAASMESKKAKPKKQSEKKRRDDDVRDVTYEQKEELAAKITQLPDERLDGALKIIAEDKPPSANEDEEIELDIDDLSPQTLYKLYRYVVQPKGKKAPSKISSSDGRKRGTGGVKRKNLDEGEEAARIARLQEQLQQFDHPEAGNTSAMQGVRASGAHDDLVASESSSGEDDSESESDFE